MKSSKLSAEERYNRRLDIMEKRSDMLAAWRRKGVTFIQSKTTRKVFKTSLLGDISVIHSQAPYPHSSARQRARYARQVAAGQI